MRVSHYLARFILDLISARYRDTMHSQQQQQQQHKSSKSLSTVLHTTYGYNGFRSNASIRNGNVRMLHERHLSELRWAPALLLGLLLVCGFSIDSSSEVENAVGNCQGVKISG